MTPSLSAVVRLAVVFGLYSLDLLDLYAKVAWIGSSESFSFKVVNERTFDYEPLPKPVFLENTTLPETILGIELVRSTGWTSFYDKCSDLYAVKDIEQFDMVKAVNCDISGPSTVEQYIADELVLSASISVDSIAWVSCQLLFFHRRPQLCQENLVTLFSQRYQLVEEEVDHDKMAPINSMAESELLRMLNLLSRSHPLSSVVCAQGFESTAGPGHYDATLFICGSPNVIESAVVGVYASTFAAIHKNLAWLAVDKVNVMGFELLSRQNGRSKFILHEKNGEIVVVEKRKINFVTFGYLYVAMILIDIALLVAHGRATFDTIRMFKWKPLLSIQEDNNTESGKWGNANWLLLYRSLYRSGTIARLTILSSLISWLVNFPFALMWCSNSEGGIYAIVSAVRVWMLVLCLLNLFWGIFVRIREARAYEVVQSTFVSPLEVIISSTFVVFLETNRLFRVAEIRRQLEGQVGVDTESFPGQVALSNIYNEEVDGFATTPPHILHVLFGPLAGLITEILMLISVVLIVKSVYYHRKLQQQEAESANAVAVVDFDNIDEHLTGDISDHHTSKEPLMTHRSAKHYHRLPLEELLRTPARASSLVRCCFDIDLVEDDGLTYMLPHVYYDFGVVVSDAGFLRTRRGFSNVIQRRLDVETFFAPIEQSSSVLPSPVKRQRFADEGMPRTKFAFDKVSSPVETMAHAHHSPSPPRTMSQLNPSMARSMRRRKSMEELLEYSPTTF
ncbi:Transmembrane protein [Phytophthora megakarya]|uniref:Transmembrane protein n=1 Tax=Phytophthora megakarya TaxID=4795 RepID=A0A225W8J9_9STRA|nr:Transmembrane protein [Phytophthora megakarya]